MFFVTDVGWFVWAKVAKLFIRTHRHGERTKDENVKDIYMH